MDIIVRISLDIVKIFPYNLYNVKIGNSLRITAAGRRSTTLNAADPKELIRRGPQ